MAGYSEDFTATGAGQAVACNNHAASLSGTFVATFQFQRSFDSGSTWVTIATYTAPVELNGTNGAVLPTRWNCSAYTSGTATGAVFDDAT